jgi:hypothetical protein
MSDLRRRFRGADEIETPDQWPSIVDREPGEPLPTESHRRTAVVLFALAIGAAAVAFAVHTIGGPVPVPATNSRSVTRIVDDGQLRCTATIPAAISPAQMLSVDLDVTNISTQPLQLPEGATTWSLRVVSSDGQTYDTAFRARFEPVPTLVPSPPLLPGHSTHTRTDGVAVQWGGPLTIAATCAGDQLPPLSVPVTSAGQAPPAGAAIRESLRKTGGLFRGCSPPPVSGVPVVGTIAAPDGQAPPLDARCEADIRTYDGFDVVTLSVITPPDARFLLPTDNVDDPPTLPAHGPAEGVVWRFVVTEEGATAVGGSTRSQSWSGGVAPSNRRLVPDFTWDGTRWSRGLGSCGSQLLSVGPRVGAIVQFISACPRVA